MIINENGAQLWKTMLQENFNVTDPSTLGWVSEYAANHEIYEIIKEISDENSEYYLQAIKGCCQGTKNSYKGFRWHYVELDSDNLVLKGKFLK